MKTLLMFLLAAVLLLAGESDAHAQAVIVWYQPTPYPARTKQGIHVWDGWLNNYYPAIKKFQDTDQFEIGGWTDRYISFIKFDLTGLPQSVDNAYLYLYSLPRGGAKPSQVALHQIASPWDTTMQWGNPNKSGILEPYSSVSPSTLPKLGVGYSYSPSPGINIWYNMSISEFYSQWKNGTYQNYGIMMYPNDGNNNQFDYFVSSNNLDDTKRPVLRLDFTPTLQLKMPLPGNHRWLITTEVGGYDCKGQYDKAHDDIISTVTGQPLNNYFSIDFSSRNIADSGSTVFNDQNIPVIASLGGRVAEVGGGNNVGDANGYYIILDHDKDVNKLTGFTTRYLHMKQPAAKANGTSFRVGEDISQGDQIGIMGTTGKNSDGTPSSFGVHLHFGVRYNDSGAKTTPELAKVIMEGVLLKSFQTECSLNSSGVPIDWNRYYRSSNRVY